MKDYFQPTTYRAPQNTVSSTPSRDHSTNEICQHAGQTKPEIPQSPTFHLLKLRALKSNKERYFKVYQDDDVIAGIEKMRTAKGEEAFVQTNQDDDLESDEDVVRSGIKTSMRDMLVVRDAL